MKILIHSNGPHVPSGYGKQARMAGLSLRELGHDVAFSCFSGLGGQPIKWEGFTLFPGGMLEFGVDVIGAHAMAFGADVVIPIMDLWKLLPVARELGAAPFMMAPLLITDCLANNGGPSIPDQQTLAMLQGYPAAVSQFGVDRLAAVGVRSMHVPHCYDPHVYRPFRTEERLALRKGNGTADKFVIGMLAANNDTIRKGFAEQFSAFARFSRNHPDAMLNVYSVFDSRRGHNLPELASDMGIFDKVMFMPTYEQVAGLLGDEFTAAWYNSIDLLTNCSYGEGFGVPILEAQACGVPVVVTDCSAMHELGKDAGHLVRGKPFWNPIHRAWWTRPNEDDIVRAWEDAYKLRGMRPERSSAARAAARPFAREVVRDECWAPYIAKVEEVVRVLREAKTGIVTYDGLKWHADRLTEEFGDTLALEHESDYAPYITGRLKEGDVFVDVGAHVGHWTVRAAAQGVRVIAVEADPVTAERLQQNLDLNGLEAEIVQMAAWDEFVTLHLNHQNQELYDGTNQTRPDGDGAEVYAGPLDEKLFNEDRIDLIKIDVEGADLHVLRGLRETIARCHPTLFIEDHSVHGFFASEEMDALLVGMGYAWEFVAPGYRLADFRDDA